MDYPIEIRICTRRIAMPDKESQKPNDLYRMKNYFSKWQMQKTLIGQAKQTTTCTVLLQLTNYRGNWRPTSKCQHLKSNLKLGNTVTHQSVA